MPITLDGSAGITTPGVSNSGNESFNAGFGSAGSAYGCRAWVNFNGTGTVAIRASGNVTSITDNGTGDYTVNFTNAMPDANYSVSLACQFVSNSFGTSIEATPATGSVRVGTRNTATGTAFDSATVAAQIVR